MRSRGPLTLWGLGLLLLGLVLAVGACTVVIDDDDDDDGSLSETGIDMAFGRYGHTGTALPDGSLLVIGGVRRTDLGFHVRFPSESERYDPLEGGFDIAAESVLLKRAFHGAAFSDAGTPGDASDDYVLIAGGIDELDNPNNPADAAQETVVRVLTGDGSFAVDPIGALPDRVMDLAAVALPGGATAFIGGRNRAQDPRPFVQIWSGDLLTTTLATLTRARFNHRAAFVPNDRAGWIVVSGGRDTNEVVDVMDVLDLEDLAVYALPGEARQYHTLTVLDNGTPTTTDDAIVETGGLTDVEEDIAFFQDEHEDSVVAYRLVDNGQGAAPSVQALAVIGRLPEPTFFHAAAASADGRVALVTGGFRSLFVDHFGFFTGSFIDSAPQSIVARIEYDAGAGEVTVTSEPRLQRSRAMHAASLLPDGTIFITGGINGDRNSVRGAEILLAD